MQTKSPAEAHTIRSEEQQLGLAIEVNQTLLDTRCLAWDEQIDDRLFGLSATQDFLST